MGSSFSFFASSIPLRHVKKYSSSKASVVKQQ